MNNCYRDYAQQNAKELAELDDRYRDYAQPVRSQMT